ncbi:MAG: hypothetical protein ACXW25_10730 [Rhodospirillales bacterium]
MAMSKTVIAGPLGEADVVVGRERAAGSGEARQRLVVVDATGAGVDDRLKDRVEVSCECNAVDDVHGSDRTTGYPSMVA